MIGIWRRVGSFPPLYFINLKTKIMYKQTKKPNTTIKVNESYQGETLEQKIRRVVNNREPITDGAPLIYTERKDGVRPEYNIRTDRFEVALDAMDKVAQSHQAKREARLKVVKPDRGEVGGAEPIQATGSGSTE